MSIARQHRLLSATKPTPFGDRLCASVERMVAIQMKAYPADWSDEDKREMAERHLFGVRS